MLEEFSFAKEGAQRRKAATDYLTRPKRRRIRDGSTDSRIPGFSKDHVLIRAFRRGVGLHTYNTDEERPGDVHWQKYQSYLQNVESSLRTRHLAVVFCSESLALGVNLPVKSVIVAGDSPRLNPTTLRHMVGRAGRWGLDLEGSAIFLGISPERQNELMTAPVADVRAGSPASWLTFDECALGIRERRKFCKLAGRCVASRAAARSRLLARSVQEEARGAVSSLCWFSLSRRLILTQRPARSLPCAPRD